MMSKLRSSVAASVFCVLLLGFCAAFAAEPAEKAADAKEFPLHLGGNPNYVFVWGNDWSGDYIVRDSLRIVRHTAPSWYEITVEVAFVGDVLQGNREVGSTKRMGFEYSFEQEGRRLLYSPEDNSGWGYIDANNNRGMNAERKAIAEMAYYLAFGKPFYGYLSGFDSRFYDAAGLIDQRIMVGIGSDGKGVYYICPGTIHETRDGFSMFVKHGADAGSMKDYIVEYMLQDGILYYSYYIQGQAPSWQPVSSSSIHQRMYRMAENYRSKEMSAMR